MGKKLLVTTMPFEFTPEQISESIEQNSGRIRGDVGRKLKNLRKIPALKFFIDDSLDYASKIDELLKK